MMGKLLSILSKDYQPKQDIFVDFEDAKPTEDELVLWTKVREVLEEFKEILQEMQAYKGAANEIREAISNPNDEEKQTTAWQTLCPLVAQLKRYYLFSKLIEEIVPSILERLCSTDMTPEQHLETQQALFKQFAEILDFTLKFDDLKMTSPAIQNDFSYYRRTLNRSQNSCVDQTNDVVSNELANKMSMFYANATPMLRVLSDCCTLFVSKNKDIPVENTTDCLAKMANICRATIENPALYSRFQSEETMLFCLRVMVGVIILYDHVHPVGAFVKTSNIDVKSSVKVLKEQSAAPVEGLLNALRYTTKHLNDDTTPKNVKALLVT